MTRLVYAPLLLAVPAALAGTACSNDDNVGFERVALIQYDSCSELESDIKNRARHELEVLMSDRYGWGAGGVDDASDGDGGAPEAGADEDSSGDNGGRQEGEDFSGTNNQEDGVDEADLVKTDGYRIYLVDSNGLHVFGVPTFGELVTGEVLPIEGHPSQLLLDSERGRAAVFSMVDVGQLPEEHPLHDEVGEVDDANPWYWRSPSLSKITIVDLSDPDEPEIEREIWLEGWYQTARRTDASVSVVANGHMFIPGLDDYWLYAYDSQGNERSRAQILAAGKARINAAELDDLIPRYYTRTPDGELSIGSLAGEGCGSFYYPTNSMSRSTTSIVSFDLASSALSIDADTVVSNWATVYASEDRLYLAESAWDWWWPYTAIDPGELFQPATNIHAFDVSEAGEAAYVGSGRIDGTVIDQFALDEQDGLLRVAATTQPWRMWREDGDNAPPPPPESHVYVLEEGLDGLETVGHLGGIAPGERIFSARFQEDRGFVVTFEQIDPLFTIDLSNPRSPALVGELEVFGFSTYLHPIADGKMLAIGVGGDENGANWKTQISMFDVSDLSSPELIDTEDLAGNDGWGWSEAQYEHKAFQYFAPVGLLAVPQSGYTESYVNGQYNYNWTSKLELISVEDDGLSSYGSIDHSDYYGTDWWGSADIRRSIFMGDFVYAISSRAITVHALDGLGEVAASELPEQAEPYWWW